MKKIIVAIDGLNYKPQVTAFAIAQAKQMNGLVVGVFLHDRIYHSYRIYDIDTGMLMDNSDIQNGERADQELRESAVRQFTESCNQHNVNFIVRENRDIALFSLLHESQYADQLIIHAAEQFNHFPTAAPSRFMQELLERVQCPVILVPNIAPPLEKVVLLYDGSPASVHAIRCFCQQSPKDVVFPMGVAVWTVKKSGESLHLTDDVLIKEYLNFHFPEIAYKVWNGDADLEIPAMLKKESPATLVVLGAYQRGAVSRWFQPSMADVLLSTVALPLFIAHSR